MSSSPARVRALAIGLCLACALGAPMSRSADGLQPVEARPGSNDVLVEMGALGAPDTSGLGLLTPSESGMPKSMWTGTPRSRADALLEHVPKPTRSRALQSLGHRVLLTEANAPQNDGATANFLALRLNRLIALGDLESVVRISDELIVGKDTSEEQEARADALLLRGADGDACLMARQMLPFGADIYWTKLDAYCKARSGDAAGGEFNLALIRERDPDPVFFTLYDRLVLPKGDSVQPAPFDGSALAFAFLRASKSVPDSTEFISDQPAFLRAVSLDAGGTSADVRLTAAVTAAAFGAFPIDALRALFTLQGFAQEALADPPRAAGPMVPARALALFYQAIAQSPSPLERVKLASVAYRYAARHDIGPVLIDLASPLLDGIAPDRSLAPFAFDMTQASLAAGDSDGAARWFAAMPSVPPSGVDPVRFERLRAAMSADRNTLAAVTSNAVVPSGAGEPGAPMAAFTAASGEGRVAEGILLALQVFDGRTPAQAGDGVVGPIVAGLANLGLAGDAQAILREAALTAPDLTP